MKPADFEYHRPETLTEALDLLAQHGDEAKPLAGGQSLVPLLAMRLAQPAHLIDLERLAELGGVSVEPGGLRVGAMTRQAELERGAAAGTLPMVVREAIPHIGHFQIRNRGTVGGSLAHCDPAAEWPALLMLLEGTVTVRSTRGDREIEASSFCLGPLTTALDPDELLVDVHLPAVDGPSAFVEVERRFGDFALVGAGCAAGRTIVFGAGPRPQRLREVEAYVAAGGTDPADVSRLAAAEIEADGDLHAPASYRRDVGARLVASAVARCLA